MRILTSHVGYDAGEPKRAVMLAARSEPFSTAPLAFRLLDAASGARVFHGLAPYVGPVPRWRDWVFWSLDFSEARRPGRYLVELTNGGARILADSQAGRSASFEIGENLLLERTVPAVLRWFRSQRCAGPWDEADRRAPFFGGRADRVDAHGGWYDASGDYSKYLSHLSYANYLNPQHSPLAVWVFLACARLLADGPGGEPGGQTQGLKEELQAEARYGAEFLRRMQDPAGYFYIGVFDRWTHEPGERRISSFRGQTGERGGDYQAGYRQGGGLAIAALARAARELPGEGGAAAGGQGEGAIFLQAAKRGFAHLEAHNREYLDDGRENIIDDYCALLAASELFAATGQPNHLRAARRRARGLEARLGRQDGYRNFWRADARGRRPFFHASDAGLPVIALLRYARVEPSAGRVAAALRAVRRSLEFELSITTRPANPFGYARQYVQPVDGPRREAFFFPHHNESGYWWQGENARLASLAAAARLSRWALAREGAPAGEGPLAARLGVYASDQLGWILGCNPFDACFLHGFGRSNPEYETGFPNAFGGICNGVTGGFRDEEDVDFLPSPHAEDSAHRWRWSEQWLPHAAWYLLAACSAGHGELGGRAIPW
ncbi:MAG: hypothetical protein A2V99_04440 [Spirochaetes bacterium RBG_16_67_19]|nr:MAG: hypothetical protein A2V99_04440 [Spirochaetes bacterium RBG_16_67_19]